MDYTVCMYEQLLADGLLRPQVLTAGITNTPTVDMSGHRRVLFIVGGGHANAAATTLDITVMQCTQANDGGADAKILAGKRGTKAITQVAAGAAFAAREDGWLIEVRAEEMDVNNGFAFLLLRIVVSALDTWELAVMALRDVSAYKPVDNSDVTEIVD